MACSKVKCFIGKAKKENDTMPGGLVAHDICG